MIFETPANVFWYAFELWDIRYDDFRSDKSFEHRPKARQLFFYIVGNDFYVEKCHDDPHFGQSSLTYGIP